MAQAQFSQNDKNQTKIDRMNFVIDGIIALDRFDFVRGSWFDVKGGVFFQFYSSMKSNRNGKGVHISDKLINTALSADDLLEIIIDRL